MTDGSEGMISQVRGLSQNISNKIEDYKTDIFFPWSKLQPGYLPIFKWIFKKKIHDINKEVVVRTNHGLEHPEQGYTSGPDKLSSQLRMKNAMDVLNSEKDYKKMFPRFYNHTQSKGAKYDLVRAQNK